MNWYVVRDGEEPTGPFSFDDLRRMAAAGRLTERDLAWKEGMTEWTLAASVPDLLPASRDGGDLSALQASTSTKSATAYNPYAAPTVDYEVVSTSEASSFQYADYLPRVAAYVLDGIFLLLMQLIPSVILFVLLMGTMGEEAGAATAQSLSNAFSLAIGAIYFIGLETSAKQGTWGKQIMGIKVTDMEGNRLGIRRASGRFFAKWLNICALGIGYLMPLFTARRQTLHDMLAGCLAAKR